MAAERYGSGQDKILLHCSGELTLLPRKVFILPWQDKHTLICPSKLVCPDQVNYLIFFQDNYLKFWMSYYSVIRTSIILFKKNLILELQSKKISLICCTFRQCLRR